MGLSLVPFAENDHLEEAVAALLRVRSKDRTYPPPQDAEPTPAAFAEWLLGEPVLGRWVALYDGDVVGHVQLTPAHPYLVRHLDSHGHFGPVAEMGKLFVDPAARGRGAGLALLNTACALAEQLHLRPGLAVLPTSRAAVRLYRHAGMQAAGTFMGVHGENIVMLAPVGQNDALGPVLTM